MNIWNDIELKSLAIPSLPKIALGVCIDVGVNISKVRSESRKVDLVEARHKIAREACDNGYTTKQIGEYLNRDPSTILYYLNYRQPQSA